MFFSRAAALGCFLLLASCTRNSPPAGVTRVAILPFENLSGDASLDWLSDAAPHVVVWQQASSGGVFASAARNTSAAVEQDAQRILRGTIERARGGRIRLEASLEDRATRREAWHGSFSVQPDASLFGALTQIAAALGASPRPYSTANANALRALAQGRGLAAADPAAARERFSAALAADPDYAPARLALAQLELSRRDLDATRAALQQFRAHAARAQADEKAEADQLEAALANDQAGFAQALTALSLARPANATLQIQAAETSWRRLDPQSAAAAWERLLRLQPANTTAWRMIAYSKAAAGDFPAARTALDRYQALAPQDPNTLDSRAEIEYQAGRYAEAAQLFEKLAALPPANPESQAFVAAAWTKAAYARLLAGQDAPASQLFEKGLTARRLTEPQLTLSRAAWLAQTGRRADAFKLLAADAPEPSRRAFAAQRCWLHAAAGQWAEAATAAAAGQGVPAAAFCGFLAQPEASEAEWQQRASGRFGPNALRPLAYALALRGHCAAAIAPLRAVLNDPNLADNTEVRLLLGRCYYDLRQWPQMREVLAAPPVPPMFDATFQPLFFPSMLELKAKVEMHFERPAEAKRWINLHHRLNR